ncbi:hypothetical protein AQUCO_05500072v1 [Aquilegia coerulea]|uniref:F-box domain-containing protein n=1 Tax=Aquilegia coerulea TaxID=218851 RepID=A0A2G5CGX5_AQUCA|nr:hypothetical protein AQUCO_05500072v1 [Aquilegia coerulea]
MANIPQEIITEILTRVPAKSLLRFRCVSKPWCNLISDSSFIKTHLIRAVERNNMNLFLHSKDQHIYSVDGDTLNESMEIKNPFHGCLIHGSCNGIVCLRKENKICLMNPSTREYKILEIDHREYLLNYPKVYGFGYDDTTEDFKLVKIVYFDKFVEFYSRISVYSFKHDSWSTISNIPYWRVNAEELGIYLHGSLHWVAYTVEPNSSKRIVCVNVKENVVREMFEPIALNSGAETKLGVLEGQLCVMCTSNYIDVWVMKDYALSDSWYKLFSLDKPFQSSVGRQIGAFCFSTNGKNLLKNDSKIVIYDPKRKAMTAEAFDVPWLKIVPYVASLVSLKKGSYPRVKESSIGQFFAG